MSRSLLGRPLLGSGGRYSSRGFLASVWSARAGVASVSRVSRTTVGARARTGAAPWRTRRSAGNRARRGASSSRAAPARLSSARRTLPGALPGAAPGAFARATALFLVALLVLLLVAAVVMSWGRCRLVSGREGGRAVRRRGVVLGAVRGFRGNLAGAAWRWR